MFVEAGRFFVAVANVQAFAEFALFCPTELHKKPLKDRREQFERFWNSGVARLGDEDAKGARDCRQMQQAIFRPCFRLVQQLDDAFRAYAKC